MPPIVQVPAPTFGFPRCLTPSGVLHILVQQILRWWGCEVNLCMIR